MYLFELEKTYKMTIEKLCSSLNKEVDDRIINGILEFDGVPIEYRDSLVEIAILKTFGDVKLNN